MKPPIIGLAIAGALVAAGAVAQNRGLGDRFQGGPALRGMGPMSTEDQAAFTDARIAGLHAGLKLTSEQEKLWPPVEEAIRGFVRQRREAREARRDRFASMREQGSGPDIPAALRFMADRQAASAEALRKLADAAQPLYAALDEGQKRRLAVLARPLMRGTGHGRGEGPMGRGDRRGDIGRDGRDYAFEIRDGAGPASRR